MNPKSIASMILLIGSLPSLLRAQAGQSIPSREEIDELISKADQKIVILQQALTSARPQIEERAPDLWKNAMGTISTIHKLIDIMRERGPSAYRLVALNATLDDVSRASLLSVIVAMSSRPLNPADESRLAAITSAEVSCFDISELLGHAALRLINAEEGILDQLSTKSKEPQDKR